MPHGEAGGLMSLATAMALKLRCPATCKAVRRSKQKCVSDFLQFIFDMCKVQQVDTEIELKKEKEV